MKILIIGQGIAGSCVAWKLIHRGIPCLVVDRPISETASRVAAGMVNPLTGRQLRPEWRQEECLPMADAYYQETEQELQGTWWQKSPIYRELEREDQLEIWSHRQTDPASCNFAGPLLPWPKDWNGLGKAAYTRGGAVLHVEKLVNAQREWLIAQGAFKEGEVQLKELQTTDNGILYQGEHFDKVVWCTGYEVGEQLQQARFQGRCSKGTIIDVALPEFEWNAGILHFGHWLVQHSGVWRFGATYEWTWDEASVASGIAVQQLIHSLRQRYQGEIQLLRSRAAVRPIIRYSQPVACPIPDLKHQYIFSGLGSRGVTTSPWVAEMLVEHLLTGQELPSDFFLPMPKLK